jgi:hypothetical protein
MYQETQISICFTNSGLLVLLYLHYGWPIISELTSGPVSSCCSDIECLSVPRSHTSITLLSCSPVTVDLCKPVKRTATNSHYITKLSLTLQLSSKQYGIVENRSFWLFNLSSIWIMFSVIQYGITLQLQSNLNFWCPIIFVAKWWHYSHSPLVKGIRRVGQWNATGSLKLMLTATTTLRQNGRPVEPKWFTSLLKHQLFQAAADGWKRANVRNDMQLWHNLGGGLLCALKSVGPKIGGKINTVYSRI